MGLSQSQGQNREDMQGANVKTPQLLQGKWPRLLLLSTGFFLLIDIILFANCAINPSGGESQPCENNLITLQDALYRK
jgi:hypothetical protein